MSRSLTSAGVMLPTLFRDLWRDVEPRVLAVAGKGLLFNSEHREPTVDVPRKRHRVIGEWCSVRAFLRSFLLGDAVLEQLLSLALRLRGGATAVPVSVDEVGFPKTTLFSLSYSRAHNVSIYAATSSGRNLTFRPKTTFLILPRRA